MRWGRVSLRAVRGADDRPLHYLPMIEDVHERRMMEAEKDQLAAPLLKRLKFDEAKVADVCSGIESLIQLPFRANCLNWVVGHILANRCNILQLLGAEDLRPGLNLDHYERDSDPIQGPDGGIAWNERYTAAELNRYLEVSGVLTLLVPSLPEGDYTLLLVAEDGPVQEFRFEVRQR